MPSIEELVHELEQEAQVTRRVLERIPDSRMDWRPHERSMTFGQLAGHVATLPALVMDMSTWPKFDVKSSTEEIQAGRPTAQGSADAVAMLDRSVAQVKGALTAMGDRGLANPWRMVLGDKEMGSMPVGSLFRSALFNHWYHHRGQLTVYLRMTGVSVPPIYGDSADEKAFTG